MNTPTQDALDTIHEATIEELELLSSAIKVRYKYLSTQRSMAAKAALQSGSEARVTGNVKPKYLAGVKVRILAIKGLKADCEVVNTLSLPMNTKFRNGRFTAPLSMLEPIDG